MSRPENPQRGEQWTDDSGLTWEWVVPPGTWVLVPQQGPLTDFAPDQSI
jgi:hypothetical protein